MRSASSPGPVKVAVVNDFAVVVAGLAGMLTGHSQRIQVVERVTTGPPVSDADVLLYDAFGVPDADQASLAALVRSSRGAVVVFSWHSEPALIAQASRAGAGGFVSKRADAGDLVDAIERVWAGGEFVIVGVPASDAPEHGAWPGQENGLTTREAEVVALITRGMSNQEIADSCYLSINSVKTYVRTAYRKMGVARRSQAVLWGLDHGFEPTRLRSGPAAP